MLDLFLKGGVMMWPLLGCSILAFAIVVYKLISLRKPILLDPIFIERLKNSILTQGKTKVLGELAESKDPMVQYVGIVVAASSVSRDDAKEKLKAHESGVLLALDRYMNFLHGMIAIAPMVGLMGTVLGLMQIFSGLASAASGDPTAMYGGIAIALINTVSGLAIAIFCAFFYQYFDHRIELLTSRIDHQVQTFLEFCRTQS